MRRRLIALPTPPLFRGMGDCLLGYATSPFTPIDQSSFVFLFFPGRNGSRIGPACCQRITVKSPFADATATCFGSTKPPRGGYSEKVSTTMDVEEFPCVLARWSVLLIPLE